jgi:hypothetical protein
MGYYEESWDEDGNPEPPEYVKEEPDCPGCNDSGVTRRGRRCPGCNPSRWQLLRARLRWWWMRRVWWRIRPPTGDDGPPF